MTLLHIDSSITGSESVSRKLTADIVAHLRAQRPDLRVVYRDLAAQPVPHQSEALLIAKSGAGTPGSDLQEAITATDTALDDFLAAEIVVIGAPMYNFSVPSQLKTWIDALAVAGRTFNYGPNGVAGLCGDVKLIIASTRGGIYSPPSPAAVMDHQENFLRGFFGFLGVTDITFVRAEGVRMGDEQKQQALASAHAETQALRAA